MDFRARAGAYGAAGVAFTACLLLQPSGVLRAEVVSDLGLLAAALVTAAACWRRAKRGGDARPAWLLHAAWALLWAGGQAVWTYAHLVVGNPLPFPSAADPLYVASVLAGVLALFRFPGAPRRRADRLRAVVDGLLVGAALLFLTWDGVLAPAATSMVGHPWWHGLLALAYPAAQVIRTTVLVVVLARTRGERGSLRLLMAGTATLAVTEVVYSYLLTRGSYQSGSLLDAGWIFAMILVALAAGEADDRRPHAVVGGAAMFPYLPLISAVPVAVALLHASASGGGGGLAGSAPAVIVLIALRQVLTHKENRTLTGALEERVRDLGLVEAELRRRERQLAESQDLARLGSWELDLSTGTLWGSAALYSIAGLDPDSFEPTIENFVRLVHQDDHARYVAVIADAVTTGRPCGVEYRTLCPDGRVMWTHSRVEAVIDAGGALVALRGTSQDVTDRYEAEAALRGSEERLRSVIEATPLGIVEFDADGRVHLANRTAEALYGWTRQEIEGPAPPTLEGGGGPDGLDSLFRLAMAGECLHNVELVQQGTKSTPMNLSVSVAPVRNADSDIVGVTCAVSDITQTVQLEQQLRQAQKMEAIGRLAGGIAHDFNNILTVVLGYGEMLLESELTGTARRQVAEMEAAARRAAELTDQLLTFSRAQLHPPAPADLNEVVAALRPMLERLIGEDICLRVALGEEPLMVAPAAPQLQQVLLNLAVNARDAMPDGGVLTISLTRAKAPDGVSAAVLEVTDTGVGMDEATATRIFEPFFTTKLDGTGTGLGLSTVYGVVAQHGGTVDVVSQPGAGARFVVTLPLCPAAPGEPVPEGSPRDAVSQEPPRRATVLLVEDEATVRALAREALEVHGHRVLEAADGAEALASSEAYPGPIDVLVTDVMLPQIPGPEVARRLVPRRPGLAVVFMSGYAEDRLFGVDGRARPGRFVAKPFQPQDLAGVVAEALADR